MAWTGGLGGLPEGNTALGGLSSAAAFGMTLMTGVGCIGGGNPPGGGIICGGGWATSGNGWPTPG